MVVREPEEQSFSPTVHQLVTSLSPQVKSLIINLKEEKLSTPELQLFTNCSRLSKRLFIAQYINPGIESGLLAKTHPETPHHPKQKYYLTEMGLKVLDMLLQEY